MSLASAGRHRPRLRRLALLLLVSSGPGPARAADSGDWMLMARHGECHPPDAVLRRRFADLPPFTSPEALVESLRQRGNAVRISHEAGMVSVVVPARDTNLIFVRRERCREFADGPR